MMDPINASDTFDHFFFARQPIFDNSGKVWGYELLFRNGPDSKTAEIKSEDLATICVATSGFIKAQEDTDLNKKLCINFTENLILQGLPRGLPPTITVIEVLETIQPTPQIVEKIIGLKQEGYLFAIDDYRGGDSIREFIDLADIVKVDILGMTFSEIDQVINELADFRGLKIAEKVDNREVLDHLKALGFDLYQGYYFARPENLSGRKLKSTHLSKFRILQLVEDPTVSTDKAIEVINGDPSLTYRLLRLLNTAAFGFSMKITSVRHAVMLMGMRRMKYWLRMVVLSDLMPENKTPELYTLALGRGRFLEELAVGGQISKANAETLFLFGLLSLIEVMLDTPMQLILSELPLPGEVTAGYLEPSSTFAKYLQLAMSVESADISAISTLCQELNIDSRLVANASVHAVAWATDITQQVI
ncbi:MAG: HDOD domain-containing protein [Desulfatitalea sp.]|nr:HDOD domain-containing protein [Desulfatitalea sp.]NNK00683.1 HDOD domain-containing protein [Desulfatitalea sp.]